MELSFGWCMGRTLRGRKAEKEGTVFMVCSHNPERAGLASSIFVLFENCS
jgi:hypothetical protein